jgi:adenylate cyclase
MPNEPVVSDGIKRKLTTILCADVKGYSRLMGRDKAATLSTLKDYRSAMAAFVERHHGRVVNTTGDSLMVAFDSPVEAVQCAEEVQQELAVRNGNKTEDHRMEFRIGINLGDVIVDGDDFSGGGVNIASRFEGLAERGGICIFGTACDQ